MSKKEYIWPEDFYRDLNDAIDRMNYAVENNEEMVYEFGTTYRESGSDWVYYTLIRSYNEETDEFEIEMVLNGTFNGYYWTTQFEEDFDKFEEWLLEELEEVYYRVMED